MGNTSRELLALQGQEDAGVLMRNGDGGYNYVLENYYSEYEDINDAYVGRLIDSDKEDIVVEILKNKVLVKKWVGKYSIIYIDSKLCVVTSFTV